MAQPQRQDDVHQDELCPPKKRYALMDANKKIDLDNPLCPNESKILANILQHHPLRFNIVASSSVPWIYLGQFWHTLKEDGSKYRLTFVLDRKELTMTLDDFRTIFQLPQATDNNHERFIAALKFSEMVPFFLNDLGFTLELRSPSNFKTTGLIMQMLYCFVNNIHVDYADLLWEGLHYSLKHPSTLIPYPRFTKLIISYYMTAYPKISRRIRDKYHNLEHDEMVKSIFNSGKKKVKVRMKIPSWMITDEMKLTKHYRMYAEVFRVDIPMTQSHPIESTQGTHRTTSAPRTLTLMWMKEYQAEYIILQDTIQLSIAEQKSHDDLESKQNVKKVKEHLIAEEIKKLVEGTKNIEENEVDNSTLGNQNNLDTRLESGSYKESLEVEITAFVQPVNVNEEEEESAEDDYESPRIPSTLVSSDTEKLQELTVNDPPPSSSTPLSSLSNLSATQRLLSLFKPKTRCFKRYKSFFDELQGCYGYLFGHLKTRQQSQAYVAKMIADAIKQECENLQAEITSQINNAITSHIPSQVDSSVGNYMSGHILHVHPAQASQASAQEHQFQLYLTMKDNPQLQHDDLQIWRALKIKFEGLHAFNTPCRSSAVCPRHQDDPHDDAYPEGENNAKRKKTSKHGTYVFGESSSGQVNKSEPGPSTLGNQEQLDDFDFWTDSYAIDDNELPIEKVSQELMEEMSQKVDEAKLRKVLFKAAKEIPKKGNSGPEKIVLSLHKFPAVIFPDDDIEEKTSIWELGHENKFVTKIIARRENGSIVSITEPDYKNVDKNDIEDMYLLCVNGKVEDYIETGLLWSLSVFIRSTVIWERVHDFQLVYGIIYMNNKKEKKVIRHQETHKFCDATLKRVLEGLKSYNNDVKHGYMTPSLSKKDAEYL
ncbi:hypothetical protein Tco_0643284 [Tanacetum coccineum]